MQREEEADAEAEKDGDKEDKNLPVTIKGPFLGTPMKKLAFINRSLFTQRSAGGKIDIPKMGQ